MPYLVTKHILSRNKTQQSNMVESQDTENSGPIANLHENTRLSVSSSFAIF